MRSDHPVAMASMVGLLLAGGGLFVWMVALSDAVPTEYRGASLGFGWSWSFDYEDAMQEAVRSEVAPWPWPAKETGNHLVLPLNQPLLSEGLEIIYRGRIKPGGFRLDVVIQALDSSIAYPRDLTVREAKQGFTLADRRFALEQITPYYLRLREAVR